MRPVIRAAFGLSSICGALLIVPAAPAFADQCSWSTPTSTVLHGTDFRLQLSPGCAVPTALLVNGLAVSFGAADPADGSVVVINTTELADATSYVLSTASKDATADQLAVGSFVVDNSAPSVTIISPAPHEGKPDQVVGSQAVTVEPQTAGTNGASIASVEALDPITGNPIDVVTAAQAVAAGAWVLHFDTTGWDNGPTDFTVLAIQDDGNQGSATITLDVENPATTLSETIAPSTVAYGAVVRITGQLLTRVAKPEPLAGRRVDLYVVPIGSTQPTRVEVTPPLETDRLGNVDYSFTPLAGAHYYLAFAGEKGTDNNPGGYATSASPSRPLTVTSFVAFRLTSAYQVHGRPYVGFIATTPGDRGVPFQIQYVFHNAWKTISSPRTSGAKTNVSLTFATKGTYEVRAVSAPSSPTVALSNHIRLFVS